MKSREDLNALMDQRDELVMENKQLKEQLEEERKKVSLLEKELDESKKETTNLG
ncbi:hypothetical protein [Halobacillus mangrovi]|uniref:hypothetical protein n=1 Tax=Halobacillus mangrovi TaxID=402384 RepID=UPI0012F508AC|nr:hypothetical protein [Halobacillus mangrovi]